MPDDRRLITIYDQCISNKVHNNKYNPSGAHVFFSVASKEIDRGATRFFCFSLSLLRPVMTQTISVSNFLSLHYRPIIVKFYFFF